MLVGSLLNVNKELHARDSNLGCISSGAVQRLPSGEVTKHSRADLLLGSSEVGPTRDLEAGRFSR
jgi:hypothetical protein